MGKLEVNLDLVMKYNVPGPRYTSYPPATCFRSDVSWDELSPHIQKDQDIHREISLYYHLPFCRSLCWFCGCTTIITKDSNQSVQYVQYLKKEMELLSPFVNNQRKVGQLHFGGGTPTFLAPKELRTLGEAIHSHFKLADHYEAGVEIDPRGVTQDHVKALREIGFNRISIGVQDNNPVVQKAVHRIQPREITEQVVEWIRSEGIPSLNIDLVYGLPYQTVESFERTLNETLLMRPDRFAIFSYAHVPWLKRSQRVLAKIMPTPEMKFQILKHTIEKLTAEGYVYIGMDHFALESDELAVAQKQKTLQRNFQGYSTHGGADIYGFGMSSISQTDSVYWQNQKELPLYYQAIDAGKLPQIKGYVLTPDDKIRRQAIMRVMCDLNIDFTDMSRRLGVNFEEYFAKEILTLKELESDGLVKCTSTGIEVTPIGRLLIRNIAMKFDTYLPKETERRFSRTI